MGDLDRTKSDQTPNRAKNLYRERAIATEVAFNLWVKLSTSREIWPSPVAHRLVKIC